MALAQLVEQRRAELRCGLELLGHAVGLDRELVEEHLEGGAAELQAALEGGVDPHVEPRLILAASLPSIRSMDGSRFFTRPRSISARFGTEARPRVARAPLAPKPRSDRAGPARRFEAASSRGLRAGAAGSTRHQLGAPVQTCRE